MSNYNDAEYFFLGKDYNQTQITRVVHRLGKVLQMVGVNSEIIPEGNGDGYGRVLVLTETPFHHVREDLLMETIEDLKKPRLS